MTAKQLRQLAGSVIMMGFRGYDSDAVASMADAVAELQLAGVILFDRDHETARVRNITSPTQLAELTAQLRSAVSQPVLIAVDQEGGHVARCNPNNGFEACPSHAWLGQQRDSEEQVHAHVSKMAKQLWAAGINLNFAPVVDLHCPGNPIIAERGRAFSSDPKRVTSMASAYIEAHSTHGVHCCLKHFPGHGSSLSDSHKELVDITETFTRDELVPYKQLIRRGIVDMIMVGHLVDRRLDAHPASLSSQVIDGFLRKNLGYEGVVVSDDLQMAAVSEHYSLSERIGLALRGGVDLLLFGNNLEYNEHLVVDVIDAITRLINRGELTVSCLQSHRRRLERMHGCQPFAEPIRK